jgi:NAD dependent epimerase/dehydratase family enzyme
VFDKRKNTISEMIISQFITKIKVVQAQRGKPKKTWETTLVYVSKKINRIVTMNTVIVLRTAAGTIHGFVCQTTFSCGVSF